jgi:putative CRISPR-associated protein (TIGR02619 family)
MNPLYVTVGTSAIVNTEIGTVVLGKSNASLRKAVESFLADPDDWKDQSGVWSQLQDDLVEAHEEFWTLTPGRIENPDNYRQTSAELISTYLLLRLLARRGLIYDRIVLLASATAEGRFAAQVNRRVFQSAAYSQRADQGWANVEVLVVRGLTGSSENMIEELPPILARGPDTVVRINMTGAYKGLAAALGFLAADIKVPRLHLFYLHEESQEPVAVIPESRSQGIPDQYL